MQLSGGKCARQREQLSAKALRLDSVPGDPCSPRALYKQD